jgi:hypothetical protein
VAHRIAIIRLPGSLETRRGEQLATQAGPEACHENQLSGQTQFYIPQSPLLNAVTSLLGRIDRHRPPIPDVVIKKKSRDKKLCRLVVEKIFADVPVKQRLQDSAADKIVAVKAARLQHKQNPSGGVCVRVIVAADEVNDIVAKRQSAEYPRRAGLLAAFLENVAIPETTSAW